MTTQSTIDKLIEMRLTSMSDAFRTQMEDPRMKGIPFEDRFGMLVDIEYSNRKSNSLKRLIRNAGFDQPDAYIGDINYTSGRKLNRSLIERLAIKKALEFFKSLLGNIFHNHTYTVMAIVISTIMCMTIIKVGHYLL